MTAHPPGHPPIGWFNVETRHAASPSTSSTQSIPSTLEEILRIDVEHQLDQISQSVDRVFDRANFVPLAELLASTQNPNVETWHCHVSSDLNNSLYGQACMMEIRQEWISAAIELLADEGAA